MNSELLRRLLSTRGVADEVEQIQQLDKLHKPQHLRDIDKAVSLLVTALQRQHKVLIVGDYDVDGATATALLMRVLAVLGFVNLSFLVPNRMTQGYGLSEKLIPEIIQRDAQLVITVDNGISSHSAVAKLKQLEIDVIITDHHLQGEELPNADAIVNPNQIACESSCQNLSGVGVAFYVLLVLRATLREQGYFSDKKEPNLLKYCDLVALGTIADLVPLDSNNRILCYQGLQVLRSGNGNLGLRTLFGQQKKYAIELCSCDDLSFQIAPVLNAAGRLEDMTAGIQLLLCDDPEKALQRVRQLQQVNQRRKSVQKDGVEEAFQQINITSSEDAIALLLSDCHQGVIGLVASRVVEHYKKPCIIGCYDEVQTDIVKCSARSIRGIHIRDVLAQIATQQPGLLLQFGGHAMAAGMQLRAENFTRFSEAFVQVCRAQLSNVSVQQVVPDLAVKAREITLDNALKLRKMVWGMGFPFPLFSATFMVLEHRVLSDKHIKWSLEYEQKKISAISFNVKSSLLKQDYQKINAHFHIEINDYYQMQLQLRIIYIEKVL